MSGGAYTLFDKPKQLQRFKAFLASNGCDILAPTNEWEILRFKAAGRTNIAYTSSRGRLSIVGRDLQDAASAFFASKPWRPAGEDDRPAKLRPKRRTATYKALIVRDGPGCFYCGKTMGEDWTIEHLIPQTHGGNSRVGNLALAHYRCNADAGHLSVMEKIRLRESKQAAACAGNGSCEPSEASHT